MAFNYNPYAMNQSYGYGQGYWNQGYAPIQQSYAAAPIYKTMEYVDGEIGAIAYQLPNGFPPNTFFPLWDNKEKVIYLKSVNQMGAPNPIQKLRYTIEEQAALPAASGDSVPSVIAPDMSQYVTKQDLDQLKDEIRKLGNQNGNHNRNNHNENRGENR